MATATLKHNGKVLFEVQRLRSQDAHYIAACKLEQMVGGCPEGQDFGLWLLDRYKEGYSIDTHHGL